jgi:hypothetical protein
MVKIILVEMTDCTVSVKLVEMSIFGKLTKDFLLVIYTIDPIFNQIIDKGYLEHWDWVGVFSFRETFGNKTDSNVPFQFPKENRFRFYN